MDQKIKAFGGNQPGRIILLGDGTEVLTDSDNTEMFDHDDEDQDLDSQVHRGQNPEHGSVISAPNTGALPKKIDHDDPKVKSIAEKVLGTSTTEIPAGDRSESK
jgi:protein phosphatase 2C family protein 2/3